MSVLAHVPFKGRQTDSPPAGTLSKRRAGRGWEPWPQLGLQHTWAISCPPVYTEAGNWTGIQGCNVKADTPPWDTSRDAPEVTVQHCWPPDSVCCSTATPLEDQLYLCPLHACPQLATGLPCRGVVCERVAPAPSHSTQGTCIKLHKQGFLCVRIMGVGVAKMMWVPSWQGLGCVRSCHPGKPQAGWHCGSIL